MSAIVTSFPPVAAASLGLEHLAWWQAAVLLAVLAAATLVVARGRLATLGPVRRRIAPGVRLAVLAVAVLILAGLRAEREAQDVEVIVVRDTSRTARLAFDAGRGETPVSGVSRWAASAMTLDANKRPADRLGVVSFDAGAYVDQMPNREAAMLAATASATGRGRAGKDPARALNLALATFSPDARRRLVLVWDGRSTDGDLDAALERAERAGVPVDVVPLDWALDDEVVMEGVYAPTWRREGEPFTLEVVLFNNGTFDARGTLRVEQEGRPLDLDAQTPGVQPTRPVVLRPGRNKQLVLVEPLEGAAAAGVRRFRATFEPELRPGPDGLPAPVGDTLTANNAAGAFTFVRGRGRVLYVDNVPGGGGALLADELAGEAVEVERVPLAAFPGDLVALQAFDAVILANVPRGAGGLSAQQDEALSRYVHDTAGGLLMIGGPDAFGAGGWRGSLTEAVLPLDMDVPSQRQIPKGALALLMHSTEMPQGNYWAEQCALAAVEVLNREDDVGVLSYDWTSGGSQWDFPLGPRGNGERVKAAIRNIRLGDMPDFDDAMQLALFGNATQPGLLDSDARQRHMIVISDMDPSAPSERVIQAYVDNNVSISLVQVAGHGMPLMPVARTLAERTGGTAYGPVEQNPSELPQIFVKEATVVRRTLIVESREGLPVAQTLDAAASPLVSGVDLSAAGPVFGMVVTTPKDSPLVELPLLAGPEQDPLFAHWTAGLGRTAAWTSDAHNVWAAQFATSGQFGRFFAQVVRGISRAAQSADYEVTTTVDSGRGRVVVEAVGEDARFQSQLAVRGSILRPDGEAVAVTLVQTRPGIYEADFDARDEGSYVAALQASGPGGTDALRGGTSVAGSPEERFLSADLDAVRRVAERTGGRVLPPVTTQMTDANVPGLFDRDWTDAAGVSRSLARVAAPLPVWDWLVPLLIGLVLTDVAVRRIAWERSMFTGAWAAVTNRVARYTATTRRDLDAGALERLRVRPKATPDARATRRFDASDAPPDAAPPPRAVRASDVARPAPKRDAQAPAVGEAGGMASLLEAKRRARKKLEDDM